MLIPHHIGYIVKNMTKAISEFEKLGYTITHSPTYDQYRDIDICFMDNNGYTIELISSKSRDSITYNLQKKIGNSPYHICYLSDDLDADKKKLISSGYILIHDITPAPAMGNDISVVFLYNANIGIIELVNKV